MHINVTDELYDQCIKSLQSLIQIPSVKKEATELDPYGEYIGKALDYFLAEAEKLGLPTRNLGRQIGIVEIGEGDEELGILVHLDVVPAGDRSKWRFDPFSAQIHDSAMWGRGTLDDKGPAMSVLYAMKLVKELTPTWNKRVRLIVGTDEESSWKDIEYYKKVENPPTLAFTPDGCFPVTNSEKGILTLCYQSKLKAPTMVSKIGVGERKNVTPGYGTATIIIKDVDFNKQIASTDSITVEKQSDDTYLLIASGKDGRTSDPIIENNAIHILLNYLMDFLPEEDGFWNVINFYKTYLEESNGRGHNLQISDEVSGHLTIAPCILNGDGSRITFTSNIRYPSTYSFEEIKNRMSKKIEKSPFSWKIVEHKPAIYIPEDTPFIQKLLAVYKDYFGRDEKPLSISGGTYARAFENTVAFGALIPGKPLNAHEPNERVEVEVIRDWINIYANTIYTLAVDPER